MNFPNFNLALLGAAAFGGALAVIPARRRNLDWRRRPAAMASSELQHVLIVGKPGSGKTTSVRRDIVNEAAKRVAFQMIADAHGQLADDVESDLLARGHEAAVEVLDLTYPWKVFGLDLMPYSQATDPVLKQMEDDRSV